MVGEYFGVDLAGFDEPTVRNLLAGSEEEISRAVACIHVHLRDSVVCWLRRRFPGATPDDLEDTWSETLLDILIAARQKRFQPDRPLWPWLLQVARTLAIDQTRWMASRERAFAKVHLLLENRSALVPSTHDRMVVAEATVLLDRLVLALPGHQSTVLQVYFDHFPESICLDVLHREVSLVTHKQESRLAVKRALLAGRSQLRHAMRRVGYAPATEISALCKKSRIFSRIVRPE